MKGKTWLIILGSFLFWYLFAGGSICAYEEEQQEILNSYLEELGL